jgi:hypothetical protein
MPSPWPWNVIPTDSGWKGNCGKGRCTVFFIDADTGCSFLLITSSKLYQRKKILESTIPRKNRMLAGIARTGSRREAFWAVTLPRLLRRDDAYWPGTDQGVVGYLRPIPASGGAGGFTSIRRIESESTSGRRCFQRHHCNRVETAFQAERTRCPDIRKKETRAAHSLQRRCPNHGTGPALPADDYNLGAKDMPERANIDISYYDLYTFLKPAVTTGTKRCRHYHTDLAPKGGT